MIKIAIFASGTGTNAAKLMEHFANNTAAQVSLVVSNKKDAGVLGIAAKYGVATLIIERVIFYESNQYLQFLQDQKIDFIVLAGFLWKVPHNLIVAYPNKIVNIHPALLPNYGGKGMYGMKVHETVIAAGDKKSGITIHYVNDHYDEGAIIFQTTCSIEASDTPQMLATKIHTLEHAHFAGVVEQVIINL